jgi:hypothetical protein
MHLAGANATIQFTGNIYRRNKTAKHFLRIGPLKKNGVLPS